MRITVIGTGYVGLVTGACLADFGHQVACIDVDEEKIQRLRKSEIPIYEPGLEELVQRNREERRLFFDNQMDWAVRDSQVIFIAVGTPSEKDGSVDTQYIRQAAEQIGQSLKDGNFGYKVIVNKSTVPVETGDMVYEIINWFYQDFDVVSNPEFLKEGTAIKDTLEPDRIVLGVGSEKAKERMLELYKDFKCPILTVDIKTAEVIKYANNAFLATSISFINEIANFCEKVGANIEDVTKALRLDKRIGPDAFLKAGIGYGGSCFPKDIKGLIFQAKGKDLRPKLLEAVEEINQNQREHIVSKMKEVLGDLKDKTIGVWGLAFKPNTDDMRNAPSLTIISQLLKEGADVKAFDPVAEKNARLVLDSKVKYCPTPLDTALDCNAILILTEWEIFKEINKKELRKILKEPNIIDGRNIFDPKEMTELGFNYQSIGR